MIAGAKLKGHGYHVISAANGNEALTELESHPDIGLVITDLMMPGMDGFQLTHAIKRDLKTARVPVVVYTATFLDPKDEELARELGASEFIEKPAADAEFFGKIDAILQRSKEGNLDTPPRTKTSVEWLKNYSARLVAKLEEKVIEVNLANKKLEELNAQLEDRIIASTEALSATNKELEAFAYSVSHDLQAPLRAIAGFSDALIEEPDLPAATRADYLQRIQRSTRYMQELINDLLEYSRIKRVQVTLDPVSIDLVLDEVLDFIREEISLKNASITAHRPLGSVCGHPLLLRQVLINLLSNSLKFVQAGTPPRIEITANHEPREIVLQIQDNGIGIPEEYHSRIFKVFERLHNQNAYPGTGVGLALVKQAVEKMEGSIQVQSKLGVGSTFSVHLRKPSGE